MPRLTFHDLQKSAESPEGKSVLQCALDMGIDISHVCGGDGACGTCRIEVVEGWSNLSPQTPDETYKELEPPYRLSCQAKLGDQDVVVRIAKVE
ncbi:MAG TPA: 2Fe-2S iron-sulfur cluster-binding protein [Thermoanaerobaculia bacterium]|nr:2Fe-2S iron-sulfur cluster-binding protein [Thermoanaerobaculia bacterium]